MRLVFNARAMALSVALLCSALINTVQAAETNRIYDTNCALCHQRAGAGLPGQFPRLAGRVAEIAATDAGRRYLVEVTLFGMAGKIDVDGAPIVGVMPSFSLLSDEDVAAVLNYLARLDAPAKGLPKQAKLSASDIKRVREGAQLSASQVHANRASALGTMK